ncbi:MAG TPA: putative baseplate assembly protein, partial [Steroidobacteraceae bacterium]|nr:putative baseplate assembly protein [Steroidobacteraceae bacterium]
DPVVQEVVAIGGQADAVTLTRDRTSIVLSAALQNCYDRTTVQLNANVAAATHGASVSEILGSGAASLANQSFGLKQSPVTYVSASTPSGGQSTLQVRVNDLLWNRAETLYGAAPTDPGYVAPLANDGSTSVLFGDGVEGARLPTGQNNIRAQYRVGLGTAGNLDAGSLTNLLDRPLGVNAVTNPMPATGGADAQSIADARTNVPLFALTLGRAVSLEDYRNFSQAFGGIAKAQADWIASGLRRGILVTVAGVNGATVDSSSATYLNLVSALREYGDPFVPINVQSYNPATFTLTLNVDVAHDADQTVVLPAVESALRSFYSFANRGFGQSVSVDEIATVVQAVAGVVALNVQALTPVSGAAHQALATNLGLSYQLSVDSSTILTLDSGPLGLGLMS